MQTCRAEKCDVIFSTKVTHWHDELKKIYIDRNKNENASMPWTHYEKRRQIPTAAIHITGENNELKRSWKKESTVA